MSSVEDYEILDGKPVLRSTLLARGYVRLSSGEWIDEEKAKEMDAHLAAQVSERLVRPSEFALVRLCDLLAEPAEGISYVWDKTLPRGGISVLVAKPKVGKSTLARNLAFAVASGGPEFLGRAITLAGPVVLLSLEEKRSEVRGHYARMGASRDLPILIHVGRAPAQAVDELRRAIVDSGAVLAVVDPLQRLARIPDLNDYAGVSLALEPLVEIARETNCHILMVHHARKGLAREGGDEILGSTAVFGGVDCALIMRRGRSCRTIESIQRYGQDMPRTVVSYDAVTGLVCPGGPAEDAELAECMTAIREFLLNREPSAETDIKEGIPTGQHGHGLVSRALRLLVEQGQAVREGAGKKCDPYLYSLAAATDSGFSGCEATATPTKPSFPPERGLATIPSRHSGCVEYAIGEEAGYRSTPRNPTGDLAAEPHLDSDIAKDDVGEI